MTDPPRHFERQPDRPRAALDDDHSGQLSRARLPSGTESTQTRGEKVRITAPVWMMSSDEVPAAAPVFASLGFIHLQNGDTCAPCPEAERSRQQVRLAARAVVGKAWPGAARAGRASLNSANAVGRGSQAPSCRPTAEWHGRRKGQAASPGSPASR